jgi:hypothetical protein
MEESGAPKKKKKKEFAYLPTHTQKSWVGFGQTQIFLRMALLQSHKLAQVGRPIRAKNPLSIALEGSTLTITPPMWLIFQLNTTKIYKI